MFSYPKLEVNFVYLTQQSTPFDSSCLGRQRLSKLCRLKLRLDRKCITCVCVCVGMSVCVFGVCGGCVCDVCACVWCACVCGVFVW